MKNLLVYITLITILFISCAKDESGEVNPGIDEQEEMMDNGESNNSNQNTNSNNTDNPNNSNTNTNDVEGWLEYYEHKEEILKFAISDEGDEIAIADKNGLAIIDIRAGEEKLYQKISYNVSGGALESNLESGINSMKYIQGYLFVGSNDGHLLVFDGEEYIGFPFTIKKLGRTRLYMYAIWESTPIDGETFFDGNTFSAIEFDFRDNDFSLVDAFCYDTFSGENVCKNYELSDFSIPYQYQVPTMLDATHRKIIAIPNGNTRPRPEERDLSMDIMELKEIQWFRDNQLGWRLMILTDRGFLSYDWEANNGLFYDDEAALLSNDVEDMMLIHSFQEGSVNDDFVAFSNTPEPILYHLDINKNATWWYRSENSLLNATDQIRYMDQNHSILPFLYIAQGKRIIEVDIKSFNQ